MWFALSLAQLQSQLVSTFSQHFATFLNLDTTLGDSSPTLFNYVRSTVIHFVQLCLTLFNMFNFVQLWLTLFNFAQLCTNFMLVVIWISPDLYYGLANFKLWNCHDHPVILFYGFIHLTKNNNWPQY